MIQLSLMAVTGAAAALLAAGGCRTTVEEAPYTVVLRDGACELRDYAPQVVAETRVAGSLEEAGNLAFGRLYGYITGNNRARREIAMTAPVGQEPAASEQIAMTAPVGQEPAGDGWLVSFTMPAEWTLATLPEPTDPAVRLRPVPARRVAAVRYSGTWSEARYRRHHELLEEWITGRGWRVLGAATWARYDPPFTPWFLRRNEILIPVAGGEGP